MGYTGHNRAFPKVGCPNFLDIFGPNRYFLDFHTIVGRRIDRDSLLMGHSVQDQDVGSLWVASVGLR